MALSRSDQIVQMALEIANGANQRAADLKRELCPSSKQIARIEAE
jgi:hypothetical protein